MNEYDRAMNDIRRGLTASQGGGAAELRAQEAYTALVASGHMTPIKRKYRVGKRLKQVR